MLPRNVSEFSSNLHLFDQTNWSTANHTDGFNEAVSELVFRVKVAVAEKKDPERQTEKVKKRNLKGKDEPTPYQRLRFKPLSST